MSKTKFTFVDDLEHKANLIDETVYRNIRVLMYYEALQDVAPDLKFDDKIEFLAEKFNLSIKSIAGILTIYTDKN